MDQMIDSSVIVQVKEGQMFDNLGNIGDFYWSHTPRAIKSKHFQHWRSASVEYAKFNRMPFEDARNIFATIKWR